MVWQSHWNRSEACKKAAAKDKVKIHHDLTQNRRDLGVISR